MYRYTFNCHRFANINLSLNHNKVKEQIDHTDKTTAKNREENDQAYDDITLKKKNL